MKIIKKIDKKLKLFRINKTSYNNLKLLSFDIPELKTIEKFSQNDFYYNAYHLKKYCNYDITKPLNCTIEHGADINDYVWEADVNHKTSTVITIGNYRKEIIANKTSAPVYAIGPYIAYCNPFYDKNTTDKIKKKLGSCLVVFPSHSTHWVNVKYNIEEFCKEIKRIKNEYNFDSVRICMYWKDIINGHNKIYEQYGFKCISAGHIYDKSFLPRLKSIIELSDVTMSNMFGTYIAYSTCLNKPFYLFKQNQDFEVSKYQEQFNQIWAEENKENNIMLDRLFGKFHENITNEQKIFIDKFFSPANLKTKEELRAIFDEAEQLYQKTEV